MKTQITAILAASLLLAGSLGWAENTKTNQSDSTPMSKSDKAQKNKTDSNVLSPDAVITTPTPATGDNALRLRGTIQSTDITNNKVRMIDPQGSIVDVDVSGTATLKRKDQNGNLSSFQYGDEVIYTRDANGVITSLNTVNPTR